MATERVLAQSTLKDFLRDIPYMCCSMHHLSRLMVRRSARAADSPQLLLRDTVA